MKFSDLIYLKVLETSKPVKYWSNESSLEVVYATIDFDSEPLFKKGGLNYRKNVVFEMLSKDGKVLLNLCVIAKHKCQVGKGRKGDKWINPITIGNGK
jgi:hypothetical protein